MSGESYVSTTQWLKDHAETFGEYAHANREIETYNGYAELYGGLTSPNREITFNHLATDQERSLRQLQMLQAEIPYDELLSRYGRTNSWLSQIAIRRAALDSGQLPAMESRLLYRKKEEAAWIVSTYPNRSPLLEQQLREGLTTEEAMLLKQSSNRLETEERAARHILNALEAALGVIGVSAIPYVVPPERRMPTADTADMLPTDSDVQVIETYPEEPREVTIAKITAGVGRIFIDRERDASKITAMVLAELGGTGCTHAELGRMVYGETNERNTQRARSLTSPTALNRTPIISDELTVRGLVLQRGVRTTYSRTTGAKVGFKHAVYRAIPKDRAGIAELVILQAANESTTVKEAWAALPEPAVATATSSPSVTETGDVLKTTENAEREDNAWEEPFQQDIAQAIHLLETKGLLREGQIYQGNAAWAFTADGQGMDKVVERAIGNHIVEKDESRNAFSADVYACMLLQEKWERIFRNGSRRVRAITLVYTAVDKAIEKITEERAQSQNAGA